MTPEDQATAIDNMHKKLGRDCMCDSGDIIVDRQTDIHKHTNILITILHNRSVAK